MEPKTLLFTIIIPAYNYGHLILQALNSVQSQHDSNIEIIVVDDESTDNTYEVVSAFKITAPFPVHYVRQMNAGVAATRNQGIRLAKGDYLLFLDADDYLLPNALQRFRRFLQQYPDTDLICAGHSSYSDEKTIKEHPLTPAFSSNQLHNFKGYLLDKKFFLANGASLFHRRVFEKLLYPDTLRNSEDIIVFAQALAIFNCRSFAEPVLNIFKHNDSLRHRVEQDEQKALAVIDLLFNPKILPAEFLKLKNDFYSHRCLSLCRSHYINGNYEIAKKFYIKAIKVRPLSLLELSYLKKFLQMLSFKRN